MSIENANVVFNTIAYMHSVLTVLLIFLSKLWTNVRAIPDTMYWKQNLLMKLQSRLKYIVECLRNTIREIKIDRL